MNRQHSPLNLAWKMKFENFLISIVKSALVHVYISNNGCLLIHNDLVNNKCKLPAKWQRSGNHNYFGHNLQ